MVGWSCHRPRRPSPSSTRTRYTNLADRRAAAAHTRLARQPISPSHSSQAGRQTVKPATPRHGCTGVGEQSGDGRQPRYIPSPGLSIIHPSIHPSIHLSTQPVLTPPSLHPHGHTCSRCLTAPSSYPHGNTNAHHLHLLMSTWTTHTLLPSTTSSSSSSTDLLLLGSDTRA